MDYKTILGIIAVAIGIASFVPYIRNIFLDKTKPHAFSWFIWGLLLAIAFSVSFAEGGGAGAWYAGTGSLACFFIAALALVKGTRVFPLVDWLAFFAAFISIILWWLTKTPTFSVILVSFADVIGFVPTFRKGYYKPYEETLMTYALGAIGFILSIAALETYNISTVFYPASVAIVTTLFVGMIIFRRRQDARK